MTTLRLWGFRSLRQTRRHPISYRSGCQKGLNCRRLAETLTGVLDVNFWVHLPRQQRIRGTTPWPGRSINVSRSFPWLIFLVVWGTTQFDRNLKMSLDGNANFFQET
eukprot:1700910-Rhodomonas_salina.1